MEIDASQEPIQSFELKMQGTHPDDCGVVEILVEYQWRPKSCRHCKVFGHNELSCPKSLSKQSRQIFVARNDTNSKAPESSNNKASAVQPPAQPSHKEKGKNIISTVVVDSASQEQPPILNSQEEAQVTSINPISSVCSPQLSIPILASNRFNGLDANDGKLIVELSSNCEAPKEGLDALVNPLVGGKKKKVKKKNPHLGPLKLTEQLKLRK